MIKFKKKMNKKTCEADDKFLIERREYYTLQLILYFGFLIKKVKTYTHIDTLYTEEMKKTNEAST
jgi:hypothetical protein